jgi:hypothetical protein
LNEVVQNLTHILEIKHLRTTAYHPQTNGMTERFNGTLCNALAKLSQQYQEDWDNYIQQVLFAYRIRTHDGLKSSPYEAVYGQKPRLPNGTLLGIEYYDQDLRHKHTEDIRTYAQRPQVTKVSKFREGQLVLWKSGIKSNKLQPKLHGPLIISLCGPNNSYLLKTIHGEELPPLVSGDRLQKYKERESGVGRRTVVPAIAHPPKDS